MSFRLLKLSRQISVLLLQCLQLVVGGPQRVGGFGLRVRCVRILCVGKLTEIRLSLGFRASLPVASMPTASSVSSTSSFVSTSSCSRSCSNCVSAASCSSWSTSSGDFARKWKERLSIPGDIGLFGTLSPRADHVGEVTEVLTLCELILRPALPVLDSGVRSSVSL